MRYYDIVVIGGGAAGISAAKSAYEAGVSSILLIDRNQKPGGILRQCAHRGFGLQLTGMEYAEQILEGFPKEIMVLMETTVLEIAEDRTLTVSGKPWGFCKIRCSQLILASGCLEIPIGMLPVGGTRPMGIYTAGQVQEMMNVHGRQPEGPAVILGSGDLGLIMAWHLMQADIEVAAIVEKKSGLGGMARNRHNLESYHIPLICRATITEVFGEEHLEGVRIRGFDTGKEMEISCRTLLIAAGLRPDRTLLYGIGIREWIHLCGNCRIVHPMVEAVAAEGRQAGLEAACGLLD